MWVADYVLGGYGSGAIMAVRRRMRSANPQHDLVASQQLTGGRGAA